MCVYLGIIQLRIQTPVLSMYVYTWVVVKIRVPFGHPKLWVPYYNGDPKRDHSFDNHPCIHFEPLSEVKIFRTSRVFKIVNPNP